MDAIGDWFKETVNTGSPRLESQNADPARVPPHQIVTDKLPVMTYGSMTPNVSTSQWALRLFGLVGEEVVLDWDRLMGLEQVDETNDFHCVTQWSRLDARWGGVRASDVLALCRPAAEATHVMLHCYDGYTTNVGLDVLHGTDVLFVHMLFGEPLPREHGGPVRLVIPSRYGWKSAKWVSAVEFMPQDSPGFWEQRGYHMRGEYWAEERFGQP